MITKAELEKLVESGEVLKFKEIFYRPGEDKTNEAIMKANGLTFALSEWWEVYHYLAIELREAGLSGIPIISLEDCLAMGL